MEANYKYYEIDISDIWSYERSLFLNDKTSEGLAIKIKRKAEEIIVERGEASFSSLDYDEGNESFRKYYSKQIQTFMGALNNLSDSYSLDYFFTNNSCYEYSESIVIDQHNENFDFWFALKLRQYDNKIHLIDSFLDFQLVKTFANDIKKYSNYLELIVRQYQDGLLKSRITNTVDDWLKINYHDNRKEEFRETNGNNSAKPINVDKKIEKLTLTIIYNNGSFDALKLYFDEVEHGKLKDLLNGKEIQGKICFKSNGNQLAYLFKQLNLQGKIVPKNQEKIKNWICKYFTYKSKNGCGTPYMESYLHNIFNRKEFSVPKKRRIHVDGFDYKNQ